MNQLKSVFNPKAFLFFAIGIFVGVVVVYPLTKNIRSHSENEVGNNEIVVITYEDEPIEDIQAIADEINAKVVSSMLDIGFYLFRFEKPINEKELKKIIKKIKEYSIVEDAYINPIFKTELNEN